MAPDPLPFRRPGPRRAGAMAAKVPARRTDIPGLYPSWWHFWCAVVAYLVLLCVVVGALIVVLSLCGAAV